MRVCKSTYRFQTNKPIELCIDCPCFDHDDKGCQVLHVTFRDGWDKDYPRPDYCPLVETDSTK
jgi:hypothetical protein